jgi:DNA-binding MarR family transcriptional regulator
MTEALREDELATWGAFLNAHASVVDVIERELTSEKKLPLRSYDVLVALSEAPDKKRRMHELAEHVVLSRSGLTRLVDRLERDGFLKRDICGTDRRGAYAVLTAKGEKALDAARPIYARGIAEHFAKYLDDEEVRAIGSALSRVDGEARRKPEA